MQTPTILILLFQNHTKCGILDHRCLNVVLYAETLTLAGAENPWFYKVDW